MNWKSILFSLFISLATIALVGVYCYVLRDNLFAKTPGDFGTFGDYIGGAFGALTGLISVLFLYVTYKKQLEMFQDQKEQAYNQQFENNFFEMLSFFRSTNPQGKEGSDGENLFKKVRTELECCLKEEKFMSNESYIHATNALPIKRRIQYVYNIVFRNYSSQLGQYFRSLYHLLLYIDTHCRADKKMYFDIVQAQMSTDELYVTCFNGISNYGRHKLLPLLNRSSFLENLAVIEDNKILSALIYLFYPLTKRKKLNEETKNVILLASTEGVGKGRVQKYLLRNCPNVRNTSFIGLLIQPPVGKIENVKVLANKDELIKKFERIIDPDYNYVIGCSFLQLHQNGDYEKIPEGVFDALNIKAIIIINADSERVRRSVAREEKVIYDNNMVVDYIEAHNKYVKEYAQLRKIGVFEYNNEQLSEIANIIDEQFED